MPARSVAELLRRPFDQLGLDDVRKLIADVGDERETLFLEKKRDVTPQSLAKACGAFANTLGGLLVVGVEDETDELVGIEPRAAEAQLWVKDTLRTHLLPMPPFRARWLPLVEDEGSPGVLLVVVEASSTTPHLLIRRGAIYVRNPGSSDPVPIADQRQLLSLVERGEVARERAKQQAVLCSERGAEMPYLLALAPTGWAEDFAIGRDAPDLLKAAWGEAGRYEARNVEWAPTTVTVTRHWRNDVREEFQELVILWRTGGLTLGSGGGRFTDEPRSQERVGSWFDEQLAKGREILLDLGAHGDLRVVYRVDLTYGLLADAELHRGDVGLVPVERWTSLDADEERDRELRESIVDDFRRAVGFAPLR